VHHAAWAPLIAFVTTFVAVWWLTRSRLSRLALDHPNSRSLHEAPVPRTGGVGLHLGIIAAWALTSPQLPTQTAVAFALLILVSLLEDLYGVPIALRLVLQIVLAGALAAVTLFESYGLLAVMVGIVAITWMINLYNFMDGSDGLAGGMAAFGFTFYAIAAWFADDSAFALLILSIAASATAFLVFNFHPARIFMGDVGSVPLGFLAGAFGLVGWRQNLWPWWFPLVTFGPFIVDASVTLLRRLLRRERVWQAHRDHYYQRLVQLGWGHRGTALAEYVLMLASGVLALAMLSASEFARMLALGAFAAVYVGLIASVEHAWRRRITVGTTP
jgi:UDP-GlcNAc:undecaprenyl-phosphate GlcNAc-1-phosphate transferase